jgi:hypothetical protein
MIETGKAGFVLKRDPAFPCEREISISPTHASKPGGEEVTLKRKFLIERVTTNGSNDSFS